MVAGVAGGPAQGKLGLWRVGPRPEGRQVCKRVHRCLRRDRVCSRESLSTHVQWMSSSILMLRNKSLNYTNESALLVTGYSTML